MRLLTKFGSGWKVASAVFAIAMVATIAAALLAQGVMRDALVGEAQARLLAASEAAAASVRAQYDRVASDLASLGTEPALLETGAEGSGRAAPSTRALLERRREAMGLDAALVLDREGEVVATAGQAGRRDALDVLARAAAQAGGTPVFLRSGATPLPDLAGVRLGGAFDRPAGVLAYEFSGETLDALVDGAAGPATVRVIDLGAGSSADLAAGAGPAALTALAPVALKGANLAVMAEQDRAALTAPAAHLRDGILLGGTLVSLTLAALVGFTRWRQTRRLDEIQQAIDGVSSGAFRGEIPHSEASDEAGGMARALASLRSNLAQDEGSRQEAAFKSAAFANSTAAMMMVDRELEIIHLNPASQKLLIENAGEFRKVWPEFDPTRMVGSSIDRFHKNPAHQRAILNDPGRLPWRTDITVGDMKFSLNVAAVRDGKGEHVGSLLEWADVGESRMNKGVLDAIRRHQAVAEYTLDGMFISANENYRSIFGHAGMTVAGRSYMEFVDRADTAQYNDLWRKLRAGESVAGRFRGRTQEEHEVWLDGSYNAVLDAGGKPFKVVQIATDVTQLENTIFEKTALMTAIDRSRGRVDFDTTGRVLDANPIFLSMMGVTREEVVGRHHRAFMPEGEADRAEYRQFWQSLAEGQAQSGLFRRVKKGGEEIFLQAVYDPVYDRDGKITRIVKSASDVTAIERANEAAREERARMEAVQAHVVDALRSGLGALADGDLTHAIEEAFGEDYEQLRVDFNRAITTLHKAMTSLTQTAHSIQSGAGEISAAADDLSQRTENQAATLEETAAALDELTASVRSSADGASQAAQAVNSARQDAEQSGETVRQAVAAMNRIEKSSEQISRIISVIDDIAFQTNLLALNAGVEAARAGDAGRGFAVVASEVRALAQRSSEAAKEIKGLISESSEQVGEGVDLVGQAGEALAHIVARVSEIAERVSEIASSAREQSTGLGEINTGVNQLDQVTQQNAAMVEESTAASHALNGEAEQLAALVGRFRTGAEEAEAEVVDFARARGRTKEAAAARAEAHLPARAGLRGRRRQGRRRGARGLERVA